MKSFTSPPKDNRPYEHLTFIQEDPTLPSQRKKPRTLTACDRWCVVYLYDHLTLSLTP
jgi:hypothetical protein